MAQKINNLTGIVETFAARPDLEKVHIMADGRHFFNEQYAKEANGYKSETKEGKLKITLNKVEYKSYGPDATELKTAAPAA
jgi:hypothetical protein